MSHFGIDISSNNTFARDAVSWRAIYLYLKNLGGGDEPFIIDKITESTWYINPYAVADIAGARQAGFKALAGYLFDHGGDNPAAEEAWFKAHAEGLPQADDFEYPQGLSPSQYAAHAQSLIKLDANALTYLNQSEVAQGMPTNNLWLAQYDGVTTIASHPCLIKQYTDALSIPGIGSFDGNVWLGPETAFESFFGIAPTPSTIAAPMTACVGIMEDPQGRGYWLYGADGTVKACSAPGKTLPDFGGMNGKPLNAPVVGAATSGGNGYWMVGSDGGVFTFGSAAFDGSEGGTKLNKPIVGIAPTGTDNGYWMVAADGGIFSFGSAPFYGSTGNLTLNKPIVGMAAVPGGYWLVASDGGIFTFGSIGFYGSTGNLTLNKPIVGMAATKTGKGYWLVASDGGIFSFGDAMFYGSAGNLTLNKPVVGMAATNSGKGYRLVAADGGVFDFGDAGFYGSGV